MPEQMTLRHAAEMALEALQNPWKAKPEGVADAIQALRQALKQPTYEFECPRCGHCCQQREWVGLTDEEARDIRLKVGSASDVYARAIEAALKEKNT